MMGPTGSFTVVTADIASIQKTIMIFSGLLIVIMGLGMSGWWSLGKFFADKYHPSGLISKGFRSLSNNKSGSVYYPLGILLGLLPCGPVYTALIGAGRTGMETKSIYH